MTSSEQQTSRWKLSFPEADPSTGLYRLPEPPEFNGLHHTDSRKSRFRLAVSRSSSSTSLSRLGKPSLKKQSSTNSLHNGSQGNTSPPLNSAQFEQNGNGLLGPPVSKIESSEDVDLKPYELPLNLKNKERWEAKHSPVLYIRAKYLPYKALRQQFWRAMLKQFDADESGTFDRLELTTMLDNLGSTLHESTIDGFFARFAAENNNEQILSMDQAVICLEDQLQQNQQRSLGAAVKAYKDQITPATGLGLHNGDKSTTQSPGTSGQNTPAHTQSQASVPILELPSNDSQTKDDKTTDRDVLADDKGEEHVVEIRECPICHLPRLQKKSDADIVTHIATCASQDWRQVNNIVMAGFVTSSQAQRKWYSKVVTKISYGGYKLGANSANILVQDRLTGQINEERMSVYVRLGIRLLYKGLKSREMEKKRSRSNFRSCNKIC
jgi:phosphatidylserine decarboxylase